VAPFFQLGLAGLSRVRQHCGVDVDDHLVPLAGSAGIELVVQCGLGQQRQSVRALLGVSRGLGGGVGQRWTRLASLLVQALAGRVQRTQ
jgi:hypothetical protein